VTYVIDTSILIDHLRQRAEATRWLIEHEAEGLLLSVITRAEILSGMRAPEEEKTRALLSAFATLPVDERVADAAGEYRRRYWRSHQLLLPDALIAATARVHGCVLATLNTRDFPMRDIQVKRPY